MCWNIWRYKRRNKKNNELTSLSKILVYLSKYVIISLKVWKNIESKKTKVIKIKNERIMLLSKCAICDSKKTRFIKEQEASGFLTCLGIKAILTKIPLIFLLLFLGINKLIQDT